MPEYSHYIYDSKGKLFGFNDDEDEAADIAQSINGHYELEEVRPSMEFLKSSDSHTSGSYGYYDSAGNCYEDYESSIGE